MPQHQSLNMVFARRWAVPILAQLANSSGCKFVTLTKNLDGARDSLKASLELLDTLGLVKPNAGHGHPMRPEYILTARGALISKPAASLVYALEKADTIELGLKKWSMPTLHAVDSGAERFNGIVDSLRSATDRAVSLALNDIQSMSMIQRTLIDSRPPRSAYTLTRKAKKLSPILIDMHDALLS